MNAFRLLAATAALSLAALSPSWAQLKPLGSAHVDTGVSAPVEFRAEFPGRLEWLGLRAPHGDVSCASVQARFADGSDYEVWRGGRVSHGGVTAELPQNAQPIRSLTLRCSGTPSVVEVEILGDVGKYDSEWQRHPSWARQWWYRVAPNGSAAPQRVAAD